jgi:hypothetical protein
MRKFFFFALALIVSAMAITSCDGNDPKQKYPASVYDGVWISDSIEADNGAVPGGFVMWEILNSQEILFHGEDTAKWDVRDDHFFIFTFSDGATIELEAMVGEEDTEQVLFYIYDGDPARIGVWQDDVYNLYMHRLPKPTGKDLPVTEANILGKWRFAYEENGSYDASGKRVSATRFNHVGYEQWEILTQGKAITHNISYDYEEWYLLENGKILKGNANSKPEQYKPEDWYNVQVQSNYLHLTRYSYDSNGKITGDNQQFYFRLDK